MNPRRRRYSRLRRRAAVRAERAWHWDRCNWLALKCAHQPEGEMPFEEWRAMKVRQISQWLKSHYVETRVQHLVSTEWPFFSMVFGPPSVFGLGEK